MKLTQKFTNNLNYMISHQQWMLLVVDMCVDTNGGYVGLLSV